VDQNFHGGITLDVLYGERESEPFHTQAARIGQRLSDCGCAVSIKVLPDSDHMSSVLDLGAPETEMGRRLYSLITVEQPKRADRG
jgi:arylformamidase